MIKKTLITILIILITGFLIFTNQQNKDIHPIEEVKGQQSIEAQYDGFSADTNYLELMKEYCVCGDIDLGRIAEQKRNLKIDATGVDVKKISFDELYELSKIITVEAGATVIPPEWKMMVGEVVLNRVESVEFPNTIAEVIHQAGQYSAANTDYFTGLRPFKDCVDVAANLLSGERIINDTSVVFQSSNKQGSGVYIELYSSHFGYTYLCYSNRPELYEQKEN